MKDTNASQVAQRESPEEEAAQAWTKQIPLEYLRDPVESTNGVAFLASHKASFITGGLYPSTAG
ncbi:MAG TPA: hypothetical protein VKK79_24810 [Candidatus Lokiarchaeia archaeon]|nr:hypothetical protein [Candidatus Lokiarchaeia archaeon]